MINKLIRKMAYNGANGVVTGYNIIAEKENREFNLEFILDVTREIKIELIDELCDRYGDDGVVASVTSNIIGNSVRYIILIDGQQSRRLLGKYIIRADSNGNIIELYKKGLL